MTLDSYTEIHECGQRRANVLLAQGFPLLHIGSKAWEASRRNPSPNGSTHYVRTDITYVFGRTAAMPSFPGFEAR